MAVIPKIPDTWPSYRTGPRDHMHALGVISVNFNLYENNLFVMFAYPLLERDLMRVAACERLYGDLNSETRLKAIRLAYDREADPKVRDCVDHLIQHFSVCAERRHLLMHSRLDRGSTIIGDVFAAYGDTLQLVKSTKEDWSKLVSMKLTLPHLRAIADEMQEGLQFTLNLYYYLRGRTGVEAYRAVMPTLPQKPRIPRKLTLLPRGAK